MSHSYVYKPCQYGKIIDIINKCHDKYNKKWLMSLEENPYNLKRKLVRHVTSDDPNNMDDFIDKKFLSYMEYYKSGLNDLYLEIAVKLSKKNTPITGRVKNDDSIVSKLHRKRFDDKGNYPLNKYLNDLLGFRIVDKNFEQNFEQIIKYIELKKSEEGCRINHMSRQIKDYNAYHIYFMGESNHCFPIELQLWDEKNERTNLDSHEIYKKDYTNWPLTYKDG